MVGLLRSSVCLLGNLGEVLEWGPSGGADGFVSLLEVLVFGQVVPSHVKPFFGAGRGLSCVGSDKFRGGKF